VKQKTSPLHLTWDGRLVSTLVLAALFVSACQPAAAQPADPPTSAPTTAPAVLAETAPPAAPTSEPSPTPTSPPTAVPTDTPPAPPTATATPAFQEPTLGVFASPKLGDILVGDNGMTLYVFALDEPGVSNCDANCQTLWPPLLTQGNPGLGPGVDPALVGAASLPDGFQVVTYNGRPLYYWSGDVNPGDATGAGIDNLWFVISPTGSVRYPPAQPSEPGYDREPNY
jgi:predicted lipoprotein with Yx(FWY)xxD motif